jgi:hypothetical protein
MTRTRSSKGLDRAASASDRVMEVSICRMQRSVGTEQAGGKLLPHRRQSDHRIEDFVSAQFRDRM